MTTKATKVNYTADQITVMTETYTGADNTAELTEIAAALNKTVPSVRAKLSQLGIYKGAEKTAGKAKGVTKTDIATAIAGKAGLSDAETEGLTKANKGALEKVLARLTNG